MVVQPSSHAGLGEQASVKVTHPHASTNAMVPSVPTGRSKCNLGRHIVGCGCAVGGHVEVQVSKRGDAGGHAVD